MFDQLFNCAETVARHQSSPLFEARVRYLQHCCDIGSARATLRRKAFCRGEPYETSHRWPQLLPGCRILYWIQADQPENMGAYATSLAKPNERTRLLTTDVRALYAPGDDGKSYLLSAVATRRNAHGAFQQEQSPTLSNSPTLMGASVPGVICIYCRARTACGVEPKRGDNRRDEEGQQSRKEETGPC